MRLPSFKLPSATTSLIKKGATTGISLYARLGLDYVLIILVVLLCAKSIYGTDLTLNWSEAGNHLEPLHYLLYGKGVMTHSWHAAFASNSAVLTLILYPIGIILKLLPISKIGVLFLLRLSVFSASVFAYQFLSKAVTKRFGRFTGVCTFLLLCFNSTILYNSPKLSPEAWLIPLFSLALAFWLIDRSVLLVCTLSLMITIKPAFVLVMFMFLLEEVLTCSKNRNCSAKSLGLFYFYWSIVSLLALIVIFSFFDSIWYGTLTCSVFNKISSSGHLPTEGTSLFSTGMWLLSENTLLIVPVSVLSFMILPSMRILTLLIGVVVAFLHVVSFELLAIPSYAPFLPFLSMIAGISVSRIAGSLSMSTLYFRSPVTPPTPDTVDLDLTPTNDEKVVVKSGYLPSRSTGAAIRGPVIGGFVGQVIVIVFLAIYVISGLSHVSYRASMIAPVKNGLVRTGSAVSEKYLRLSATGTTNCLVTFPFSSWFVPVGCNRIFTVNIFDQFVPGYNSFAFRRFESPRDVALLDIDYFATKKQFTHSADKYNHMAEIERITKIGEAVSCEDPLIDNKIGMIIVIGQKRPTQRAIIQLELGSGKRFKSDEHSLWHFYYESFLQNCLQYFFTAHEVKAVDNYYAVSYRSRILFGWMKNQKRFLSQKATLLSFYVRER
ncbi:hypothetical protein RCL1_001145 [Eukaryota sp. TZLM3-RCL]